MNVHQPEFANDRVPPPVAAPTAAANPAEPATTAVSPRRKRRFPWVFFAVLAVAGAGAIVAYQNGLIPGLTPPANPEPAPVVATVPEPPRPTALAAIEVGTIAPQTLAETIRVTGSLSPFRTATLSAQLSGTVLDVHGREGETVDEGDTLVEIDPADLDARVEERKAALAASERARDLASSTLENTRTLQSRNVATQAALDQAEANFANADAQVTANQSALRQAETARANATLKAPFAGVIAERMVDPGSTIAAGARLFTVVDISSLTVEAGVPASVIGRIVIGQPATLTVDGAGPEPVTATVDRINPVALSGTRSIPVYLTIDNADGRLRGGMFAAGTIELRRKEGAIAVPATALREDAAGAFVLSIADATLVRTPVTRGATWNDGRIVEVTGLAPGQRIVTAALPALAAGTAVVVED